MNTSESVKRYLRETFDESIAAKNHFFDKYQTDLVRAAEWMGESLNSGGKILICGNGGSAADSQHMAAEMVGEMIVKGRRPLPAIALTTDSSNLTAIGNDFGYEFVFLKQIQALAQKNDFLLAISTSGNSKNVLLAVEEAKRRGCRVVALTGGSGGKLKSIADLSLIVEQGKNSSRIQETHIFAIHTLVDLVDRFFLNEK